MFELYKNEVKRLKLWMFIPAIVYLLLNSASIYFGEYADSGLMIGNVHSVIFAIVTLLLGLVQFHAYKKDSRWVYLINRPASNTSLCLTLIAAGATIVLFQFAIADLLITTIMDNLTDLVIDRRHYYQAIYIFFVSIAFYLSGVYIQLCHSRGAFLVVVLPIFVIASLLMGGSMILIGLFVALWMMVLVLSVFKANIHNNQTGLLGKIFAILPYQLGLFLIIGMSLTITMQIKNVLIDGAGSDIPWNEYFADDTYQYVNYLEGNEKLILNMKEADQLIQQQYVQQLNIIKTVAVSPEIFTYVPNSLLPYQQKIEHLTINDTANKTNWVFSFDQMLFLSQKDHSKKQEKLGISSKNNLPKAFENVPTVRFHSGRSQIITKQHVYFYDPDFHKLNLRVTVSNEETILSGLYQTDSLMSLITTKNIYLFNSNYLKNTSGLLIPTTIIEIPGAYENLSQVELAEMIDSTLISLLFGKKSTKGFFPAKHIVIEIDAKMNQVSTLATRSLKHGFSETYYHLGLIISPLTNWLYQQSVIPMLKDKSIKPVSPSRAMDLSSQFKILILILTFISVLLTFWYSKNRSKTVIERWSWVTLTCLTGTIGFLTFLLLSDKNTKPNHLNNKERV